MERHRSQRLRVRVVALVLAGLLAVVAGCASLEKSVTLEMVYPTDNQTEVTVRYTVPPAPPGKVYVLWIVNPDAQRAVNVGQIPSGRNLLARATVDFAATGAIVSVEDSPNVTAMSHTWALKVGTITPTTPTPNAVGPTPTPLPFAQ